MAEGQRVSVATLYEFQFRTAPFRTWDGLRELETLDGRKWWASGSLISASGLEQSRNLSAPPATFTLSGVDNELITYAAGNTQEVTGQPCAVFIQFLQDAYTPLANPIAIWAGNMDTMAFRAGAKEQQITLTAETLMVNRIRAPYAYMTDADQQARWPGDRGMEFMPALINKTVNWLRG
ncbi:hypothetical protein [Pelagibacterium sp. H642]|uniref:hypothetical protein n=1 Tax=Pelagibacterium sp. H642 TaxID=1881069 RepID=UPI002815BA58|nr:hypothetical protein [Pelagibacterium sp. H642]WMT90979.1 hypothetical protein NO934_01620 [Pelagibacterium sp. H642]